MKNWLKKPLSIFSPYTQTLRNAKQIIKQVCHAYTGCIIIGPGDSEIVEVVLKYAAHNVHYVFEPEGQTHALLAQQYNYKPTVKLQKILLGNKADAGANTDTLDNILPVNAKANLIYINPALDPLPILLGAGDTLQKKQPYVIFNIPEAQETGAIFDVLDAAGLRVATAEGWIEGNASLNKAAFKSSATTNKGGYLAYRPK